MIACQGGGSHTAFTAGVLKRLLGADELELVSAPPFTGPGRHRGSGPARQFVQEQLSAGVRMDLTHKLIARDRVTWTLRRRNDPAGTDPSGQAEAEVRDGKVTSLSLGPLPASP